MTALFRHKGEAKKALPKIIKELPNNKLRLENYTSFMGTEWIAIGIYSMNDDSVFLGYY